MKHIAKTHLLNALFGLTGLSVGLGILVHDTAVDKAAVTALTLPALFASYEGSKLFGNNPHTHSERSSLYQAVRDLKAGTGTARLQPRMTDDRRYVLTHPGSRGHFAFGNDSLPFLNDR